MVDQKPNPHSDTDLIEDEPKAPSQGGSAGGDLQREIGSADEERTATGADPQPTSVHKSQKPKGGDEPNLPNRTRTRDVEEKASPKRTG